MLQVSLFSFSPFSSFFSLSLLSSPLFSFHIDSRTREEGTIQGVWGGCRSRAGQSLLSCLFHPFFLSFTFSLTFLYYLFSFFSLLTIYHITNVSSPLFLPFIFCLYFLPLPPSFSHFLAFLPLPRHHRHGLSPFLFLSF